MGEMVTLDKLLIEREAWRRDGKTVVWTNGCFDLFHSGHVEALEKAKSLGDVLVVGLNSDRSVADLKGEGRPLCGERERARVMAALAAVDRVIIFDGKRCDRELAALKPDIWAKSGDYSPSTLDPAELAAVEGNGGRVVFTPLVDGLSTTLLVKKIRRYDPEKVVSAASCAIMDSKSRLLLVATRYADGVKWAMPGGGQMHGESLEATAIRETREETGLEVRLKRHACVIERIEPAWGLHLVLHMFEAEPVDPSSFGRNAFSPLPGEDVVDVAWFDAARLGSETGRVLGRRMWLEYTANPSAWPNYVLMRQGEE